MRRSHVKIVVLDGEEEEERLAKVLNILDLNSLAHF
jgi:hypothetical protein